VTERLLTMAPAALALVSAGSADATRRDGSEAIPTAPLSSLHGRIVHNTLGGDVWVMNADGSGRRRITRSPSAAYRGGGLDTIHVMNPDGSRLRSLPHLYGAGDPLAWVP
jgi:hypothetical protein